MSDNNQNNTGVEVSNVSAGVVKKKKSDMINFKAFVIIALVIVVFYFGIAFLNDGKMVVSGESGDFEPIGNSVVASVNGEDILRKEVMGYQSQYGLQTGQFLDEETALDGIITERLMLSVAEERGFGLTDEEVKVQFEELLTQRGIVLEDYKNQIQESGVGYEQNLENYKKQLIISNYLKAQVQTNEITDEEALLYYNDNKDLLFPTGEVQEFELLKDQIKLFMTEQESREQVLGIVNQLKEQADIFYQETNSG